MRWKRYRDEVPLKYREKVIIFEGGSGEINIAYIAPDESLFVNYDQPRVVDIDDELFWMELPNPPEGIELHHFKCIPWIKHDCLHSYKDRYDCRWGEDCDSIVKLRMKCSQYCLITNSAFKNKESLKTNSQ